MLRAQQAAFNADCFGRVVPVLVTGPGRRPGQIGGRTPALQPVHVTIPAELNAAELIGRELPVQILRGNPNSLVGTLAAAHRALFTPSKELACA